MFFNRAWALVKPFSHFGNANRRIPLNKSDYLLGSFLDTFLDTFLKMDGSNFS